MNEGKKKTIIVIFPMNFPRKLETLSEVQGGVKL